MPRPLVSIIIVNWNGKRFLPDCLNSLSKIRYRNKEIFFVDNASTDGSASFVKKNFPDITIILNKVNLGYAEGHQEAFQRSKGELILLLSTDTIVEANLLEELVKGIYSKKNIGAVMPKLLLMVPGKKLIDSIGAYLLPTGLSYHIGREKNADDPQYNKTMEIYTAKGACMLFKKDILEITGLFDKDYFAYYEETDVCFRIWLTGSSIVYWPKTEVYHKGGGAANAMVSAFIQFHAYKNRITTFIKNPSLKHLVTLVGGTIIMYQLAFVVMLFKDPSVSWAIQKSIWWNIRHLPETLVKRKYIQRNVRKVSDDVFWDTIVRHVRLSYYYYMIVGLAHYID